MIPVPPPLQRLADEIDGWLDLRCPERALERLQPLLDDPAGRPAALTMRIRAHVRQGHLRAALPDLAELRQGGHLPDWVDLTEAWCKKRLADLDGAIACVEELVRRNPQSDIGHFNLGCYLALAGERERAIDEVTIACGLSDAFRDYVRDEPDLDGLRTDPRFRELLRQQAPGAVGPLAPSGGAEDDEDFDDDEDPKPGLN